MWQSLLYKKYLPTLMMMPTAANFFNLVIDLGSGVNLLREFLGKSYQERSVWVGVFGKGFFGKGFFRKLYQLYYQTIVYHQVGIRQLVDGHISQPSSSCYLLCLLGIFHPISQSIIHPLITKSSGKIGSFVHLADGWIYFMIKLKSDEHQNK